MQAIGAQPHYQQPNHALVESIKAGVKMQDHSLGDAGAGVIATQIAAQTPKGRYVDITV
jgi:hypothetical protein